MKHTSIILAALFSALSAFSTTYYVDASRPDDSGVATNWATAKQTIQAAIDLAALADIILVTNGTYNLGGAVAPDYVGQYGTESNTLTNRVCADKAVTIRSVNGPNVTIIEGAADPSDPSGLGPAAIRCAYLVSGAVLEGFTLTGGHTAGGGAPAEFHDYMGGGAFLAANALLESCILTGNTARFEGGGAFGIDGGTFNNCEVTGNFAEYYGGGIRLWEGGTLNNCSVTKNSGEYCGGVAMEGATMNNSIVWDNLATGGENNIEELGSTIRYTCSDPLEPGEGNINADPLFLFPSTRLRLGSPCIDTGSDLYATAADINGIPRPYDGNDDSIAIADMGCYEWDPTSLPNIYYADASRPDDSGDGMSWATAKQTIQAAIDLAALADIILVTNGTYNLGGAVAPDYVNQYGTESNTLTNRVCADKAVTIRSVNGPNVTIIEGAADPYDPFGLGPAAIRCAYLVSGAVLEGFTLTGGHTAGDASPAQFHDYMGGGAFLCTNALLDRCILSGNTARFEGGGAFSIGGGTFNNCEVTENSAENNGGGISIWEGGTLNNCTLTMNTGGWGGGVSLMDGEMSNCIVWENIATENDSNIYMGGGTVRYTCADPLPPGTGNINADPMFKNPLGNFQLREGSPCIDTGSNLYAPGMDINGIARPFDGDGNGSAISDMGCYEWDLSARPSTYYVDASRPDDSGAATNWATAKKTIQAAVDLATDADTVMVTNGIYNTGGAIAPDYTNEWGYPEVNTLLNRVCIVGTITVRSVNGADVTIIEGDWDERCAYLSTGAVLDGFTLTNGHTMGRNQGGGWFDSLGGGALLVTDAQLNNCRLINNQAAGGGGVNCINSTLNNCDISENTALEGSGGGALCEGSTLNNCRLHQNTAYDFLWAQNDSYTVEGYGGGAYAFESTLNNCLLSSNSAKFGGGIYADDGTLNNCTITDNYAFRAFNNANGGDGGGIYSTYITVLNNCIVWGNDAFGSIDEHSFYSTIRHSCLETFFAGTGNISSDPLFVDAANEDYQLQDGSLCINSGNNTYAPTSPYDLAGNPRIVGEAVDMGAYEDTTPLPMYTITTTAGANGSITPENPSVFQGNDQTFNIQSDGGYHIDSVTVDGSPIPLTNSYTFFNVQTNRTISASFGINPDTYYVDASRPDDSGAGTNWATAKQSIQAAVDLVAPTGTVWVTDGVYDIGEKLTPGWNLKNRVCMTKTTALRSVNGPEVTVIQGNAGSSNGGFDNSAIRGVFMQNGSSLSGFTVTNGYTLGGGLVAYEAQGGGIWLTAGCVVSNCIVTGNAASYGGGGVSLYNGGTLNNCLITGNSSRSYSGAGVILKGQSTVNNCTVTDNHAGAESGGGIRMSGAGILNNCIVWGNTAPGPNDIAYTGAAIRNTCSSTEVTDGVNGCITSNPLFVDATNGNFQLQYGSPCINSGNNTYAPPSPYDLAGNPRIIGGTVDMGTYEYNSSSADSNQDGIPDQWYLSYGLDCTDPTISSTHSDSDQQNNRDEYIAGFDPTDALSYFAITGFTNMPSSRIEWDGVSGRVYSVYWTTNLIDGFQTLETNIPWTAGSYTDTMHNAYSDGFYIIGVELVP